MRHIPIQRVNLQGTSIKATIQNAKHDSIQLVLFHMLAIIQGNDMLASCAAGVMHHFAHINLG
jgi:hypothetical protein